MAFGGGGGGGGHNPTKAGVGSWPRGCKASYFLSSRLGIDSEHLRLELVGTGGFAGLKLCHNFTYTKPLLDRNQTLFPLINTDMPILNSPFSP